MGEGLELEKIEEICISSNIRPKVSIRINTLKTNKEELKQLISYKRQEESISFI